jgi:hypothetical protein
MQAIALKLGQLIFLVQVSRTTKMIQLGLAFASNPTNSEFVRQKAKYLPPRLVFVPPDLAPPNSKRQTSQSLQVKPQLTVDI